MRSNERLYQQYRPKLLNICKEYAGDEDVAEDLLHDAFVIILTSLDKLENPEKIESWMTAIVRNVGYHYRQHLNQEQSALHGLAEERSETAESSQTPDYDELQSLVSQLPQGYQQVFRLSVFEGLSHREISQLLGIAPHTSSSQLFHAKRMLRMLIRQSWVLILLLIAIPTAVWKLLQKEAATEQPATARKTTTKPQQAEPVVEKPNDEPQYAAVVKRPSSSPVRYQAEAVILPDTIPYYKEETGVGSQETGDGRLESGDRSQPKDSSVPITINPQIFPDEQQYVTNIKSEHAGTWDIRLAYNGQIGQRDDYLAATTIGNGSFDAATNSPIPTEHAYDNWLGYNYYLSNSPYVSDDPETRSLINIATQNSAINGGKMEAQYEYQLPITVQLLLSRQLSKRLSFEIGLSYTRLSSTIKTGSSQAYIQERQRIHYLGIPLHLGWQWYSKAHLSLYSSAGVMLEMPIRGTTDINHLSNGSSTFQKENSLNVPCQFSTTFGLGLQYDFTPHLGIYLEPSLQYFVDDGSDIKTYRTEHPFSITLPLGIRFRW